jgi:hypothetical protein
MNNSNFLKVLVALLGAGILGLGYYTYDNYNEFKETKQILEQEKEGVINELEGLKIDYDQAIQDKQEVSGKLKEAKTRVETLISEIKKEKSIKFGLIKKYKREIAKIKAQRDELYKIADSLRLSNQQLVVEKDSLSNDLNTQMQYNDTLLSKNEELSTKMSDVINKAKVLYPANIKVTGVKIRSSGKVIETARYKRAQQIRICFTVPKNKIVEHGRQLFYMRVINPDGTVIGSNTNITVDEQNIAVSGVEEIIYEQQVLEVCSFVKPQDNETEMIKGDYNIEIYHNGQKVGTSNLTLK